MPGPTDVRLELGGYPRELSVRHVSPPPPDTTTPACHALSAFFWLVLMKTLPGKTVPLPGSQPHALNSTPGLSQAVPTPTCIPAASLKVIKQKPAKKNMLQRPHVACKSLSYLLSGSSQKVC